MTLLSRRIKRILRPFLPQRLRQAALNIQSRHIRYRTGSPQQIFSAIYRDGIWGSGQDFMSGAGSHDSAIVTPYIDAIRGFTSTRPDTLIAVDLGCGDFAVGSQLVDMFASYRACDVVPLLVERNCTRFTDPRVSVELIDLVADPLPDGDVAFIRQVLQHLSNSQIGQILPKLEKFQYLIVTEHMPDGDFFPNLDKTPGPNTRLQATSGVVLEAAPFNLRRESRTLCSVNDRGSVIKTTLYTR